MSQLTRKTTCYQFFWHVQQALVHFWENNVAYRPLLGNDRETNEITAVAKQRRARATMEVRLEAVFTLWVRSEAIWLDRPSSVQLVSAVHLSTAELSELVGEQWVRGQLQLSRCELLLLEAGRWGTGIVREPGVKWTSAVISRYQATTGEDTADRRLISYCSELPSVWISDSAVVTCSYDL
jgi:hypothetical protein